MAQKPSEELGMMSSSQIAWAVSQLKRHPQGDLSIIFNDYNCQTLFGCQNQTVKLHDDMEIKISRMARRRGIPHLDKIKRAQILKTGPTEIKRAQNQNNPKKPHLFYRVCASE